MGASIPVPLGWCLGAALRAAPGSPPGPGCSPFAAPHGAEPAPSTQYLNPLLAVPGGQCVWWAMGHILMAPVNVLVQASQHRTPRAFPWKFGPPAHQQCHIIDCPHEVLEMAGVIHIQRGQGIQQTSLLHSMPLLGASQCRETQDLASHYNLLIRTLPLLYLVEHVK